MHNKWTRVADAEPELHPVERDGEGIRVSGDVLFTNGARTFVGFLLDDPDAGPRYWSDVASRIVSDVTHWMPLPEPPKEEQPDPKVCRFLWWETHDWHVADRKCEGDIARELFVEGFQRRYPDLPCPPPPFFFDGETFITRFCSRCGKVDDGIAAEKAKIVQRRQQNRRILDQYREIVLRQAQQEECE